MKTRILLFCISCLLWASCGNSGQNYVIEGTLPSVKYDGEWIYLVQLENAPGRVDSVKITNASFSFSGQGEEMRVLRLRHLLRIYIQELLVVTEPGTIHVKADSVGSALRKMMPFRNGKRGGKRSKRLTILSGRDYGMPPEKIHCI